MHFVHARGRRSGPVVERAAAAEWTASAAGIAREVGHGAALDRYLLADRSAEQALVGAEIDIACQDAALYGVFAVESAAVIG